MKYLEELAPGSVFLYQKNKYFLSSDFKYVANNIKKMCLNFDNGSSQWIESNTMVDLLDLYYRDNEGNILALKEYKSNDQALSN